jgi:hypothetical protein
MKWNLKELLNDTNLIRDVKTVVSFLFAYVIAVVSNGLIQDFSPATIFALTTGLGAFGTYFAIRIITNEFTERGMYDEEENNAELQERLATQRKLSTQIQSAKAYDILLEYNKDKQSYLKKMKYEELKNKLELEIKRLESLIDHAKLTRKLKWTNWLNKRYIAKLDARKRNVSKKLKKLSMNDIYVKYVPVQLAHLKLSNVQDEEDKYNEAQRFRLTPQKKVRKKMNTTNFLKTFFFVSFQGAVIATVTSWVEFLIFLGLMTLTLSSTAVFAYVSTRRYASMNYVSILDEKIEKLQWLITKQTD